MRRRSAGSASAEEAVALAKECDTVIFVGGLNHDFDSGAMTGRRHASL